jgi:MerR HTH family regulatory protein
MTTATQPLYRTNEVADMIGTTYRKLDYWLRNGMLHPRNPLAGEGSIREWRPIDVRVARALVAFSAFEPRSVNPYRSISDALYEAEDVTGARFLVVFADGRTVLVDDAVRVAEPCWIYPLKEQQ